MRLRNLYIAGTYSLSLLYFVLAISAVDICPQRWRDSMLSAAKSYGTPDHLQEQLRRADAITAELISSVIAAACPRFCALSAAAKTKVNWLIRTGAWIDATLELIKLELPQWRVRRLSQSRGIWTCFLMKETQDGHDDIADGSHQLLPLAILHALLRVRHATA
jgi:hypothetical protein